MLSTVQKFSNYSSHWWHMDTWLCKNAVKNKSFFWHPRKLEEKSRLKYTKYNRSKHSPQQKRRSWNSKARTTFEYFKYNYGWVSVFLSTLNVKRRNSYKIWETRPTTLRIRQACFKNELKRFMRKNKIRIYDGKKWSVNADYF